MRNIEYSHSNLDEAAQKLLLCLCPFTGVVWQNQLTLYIEHLRQQEALAEWLFERWQEVMQTAQDWGLLTAHDQLPRFLHLQPTLPYFLKTRLERESQAVHRGIEMAFRQYYDELSRTIGGLLDSKEARERQLGEILARVEYENLITALSLALDEQVSILHPYGVLSTYLDRIKDKRRGLALGETVLPRLQAYPLEALDGQIGAELAAIVDNIARRQLNLRQYGLAEISYQEALRLLNAQKALWPREPRKRESKHLSPIGRGGVGTAPVAAG